MMPDWKTFALAAMLITATWCFMYAIIWTANALGLLS